MTIAEMEAFLTVVRRGSISAAAEELFITQPALSRRIQVLEEELGYALLQRQKGVRGVRLTAEGQAFLPIARKWQLLWKETSAISDPRRRPALRVSAVESVSLYVLPAVFRRFLVEESHRLSFHSCHSREAYSYMESGLLDLAFVTDQLFARGVRSDAAFSEPFVLVSASRLAGGGTIHPRQLAPEREIRFPWNRGYDDWHARWFDESIFPGVSMDQVSLLNCFLRENSWAIVPRSMGEGLRRQGVCLFEIQDGPEDRVIYSLIREGTPEEPVERFLAYLKEELNRYKNTAEA